MPIPYCNYWSPLTLWWFVADNALIGLAYWFIPGVLWFVGRTLRLGYENVPKWAVPLLMQFGLFIFFCGGHHFIDIYHIWWPIPGLRNLWDTATAAVSWSTIATIIILVWQRRNAD